LYVIRHGLDSQSKILVSSLISPLVKQDLIDFKAEAEEIKEPKPSKEKGKDWDQFSSHNLLHFHLFLLSFNPNNSKVSISSIANCKNKKGTSQLELPQKFLIIQYSIKSSKR